MSDMKTKSSVFFQLTCIGVALVLQAGCATPKLGTRSGFPEIETSATKEKIRAAVLNVMLDRGGTLVSESENTLVIDARANAWASFWLTNTLTGEEPRIRYRFTLVDNGATRRVMATPAMVHAPSLNGRTAEAGLTNQKEYRMLQWMLECAQADVEGKARPDRPRTTEKPATSPRGR